MKRCCMTTYLHRVLKSYSLITNHKFAFNWCYRRLVGPGAMTKPKNTFGQILLRNPVATGFALSQECFL